MCAGDGGGCKGLLNEKLGLFRMSSTAYRMKESNQRPRVISNQCCSRAEGGDQGGLHSY